jgi:hypothetical protein
MTPRARAPTERIKMKSLSSWGERPFTSAMRVSGTSAAAASYAVSTPKAQAQPVRGDKPELQPSDGFASTQLPPGVGENLNVKA